MSDNISVMDIEIKDSEVNALFSLILRLHNGIEEASKLKDIPPIQTALRAHVADSLYIEGTILAAKGALLAINEGVESIRLEVTKSTKEWSHAWASTHKEPLSLRIEDLEACHRSLVLAIRRMKSWTSAYIKNEDPTAKDPSRGSFRSSDDQGLGVELADNESPAGVNELEAKIQKLPQASKASLVNIPTSSQQDGHSDSDPKASVVPTPYRVTTSLLNPPLSHRFSPLSQIFEASQTPEVTISTTGKNEASTNQA
jgi:hypothetical protein